MEKMFHYAYAFNQKLNNWNVARVANMEQMFFLAIGFNQNLCNFGTYYDPTKTYQQMFSNSGCDDKTDPKSKTGPWCQSCSGDAIDTAAQTIELTPFPSGSPCSHHGQCQGGWCNDSGLCDVLPYPEFGPAALKSTRLLNGQECTDDSECKSGYCDLAYGDIDIDNVGHCVESRIHSTQEAFTGVSFKCLRYIAFIIS